MFWLEKICNNNQRDQFVICKALGAKMGRKMPFSSASGHTKLWLAVNMAMSYLFRNVERNSKVLNKLFCILSAAQDFMYQTARCTFHTIRFFAWNCRWLWLVHSRCYKDVQPNKRSIKVPKHKNYKPIWSRYYYDFLSIIVYSYLSSSRYGLAIVNNEVKFDIVKIDDDDFYL